MSTPYLAELLSAPWAIVPEKLLELQAIYAQRLSGQPADLEAIEAQLGRPLANEQQEYQVLPGGVAVLEVAGVIAPKANMFTRVSGGTSAAMLLAQVNSMQRDSRVLSALIDWDTPGGNVLGIPGLAQAIGELAALKPTVSLSTGLMCSGGYWAGSAANAVFMSGLTDYLGSIGVVQTHRYDPTRSNVQTTEVTAGKYKRIVSDSGPLSAEGKAYMQSQVDEIYRVMVDTIAANRGVSVEDVLARMADGRTFIGQQALNAGLADGVMSRDALIEQLATQPRRFASRRAAVFAVAALATPTNPQGVSMTPQQQAEAFAAEHPEAAALLRTAAAAAERERIQAVRGQVLAGHEKLIEQLAFDGKTTGPEAAVAVLQAERALASNRAAALAADTPSPLPAATSKDGIDDTPAATAAPDPLAAARSLSDAIVKKQAEAKALGRTLSAPEALRLVQQESNHG